MIFVATASKSLNGATWVNSTNPTRDSTSFGTQSTFIFPFQQADGHTTYMAMLDAWNMGPDGPHHKPGGLANMTNVWLPMIPPATGPAPNVTAGALLELDDCVSGASSQQFTLSSVGAVVHSPSGLCVQSPSTVGGQLALAVCAGSAEQAWALGDSGSTITNGKSGNSCVDFNNANDVLDIGNPVITWQCGSPAAWNERWRLAAAVGAVGEVEALDQSSARSGRCLSVSAGAAGWTINWLDSWSLKDY